MSERPQVIIYRDYDDDLLASFDGGYTAMYLTLSGEALVRNSYLVDKSDGREVWRSE